MRKQRFILLVSFCFLGFSNAVLAQYKIPEIPKTQTSVYDYINLLSSSEKNSLEQKLIRYSDTTSTQIVVAIINSTEGENINFLGAKWGQEWKIGQEKEDNGILILLAKEDRKIAINTGYGMEHLLTDALSKRIIERDIIPYFKQNDYYGGLNSGVDAVFKVMLGEYQGSRKSDSNSLPIEFILFIVFIIFFIAISNNRKGGGNRGKTSIGLDILDAIILSNMGRGSFRRSSGGFGGGSGGFGGGFGGGSFGGGGASGSW